MLSRMKEWLKREWGAIKKSGCMVLAWGSTIVGTVLAGTHDLYNDPSINQAIQAALKPEYVPYYVIGMGILLRYVRKHNSDL